jgi:phage gp46-like protein
MVDVDVSIRQGEELEPQPNHLWDTQYTGETYGWDWVRAGPDDPLNRMGLRATRSLDTAILIQMLTWRRAEPYDVLPSGSDPKGWWGDSVDLEPNESQIGSRLWLLYREPLNDRLAVRAKNYTIEALQTFIDQGVVVRFDIETSIDRRREALLIDIEGYSQDGQRIYEQRFSRVWRDEFAHFTPRPGFAGWVDLK